MTSLQSSSLNNGFSLRSDQVEESSLCAKDEIRVVVVVNNRFLVWDVEADFVDVQNSVKSLDLPAKFGESVADLLLWEVELVVSLIVSLSR